MSRDERENRSKRPCPRECSVTPEKILVGTSVSFNLYPSQLDVRTERLLDSSFKTFKNSRKANQDIFQVKDHVRDIHNSSHPKANMIFFILAVGRVKKIDCESTLFFGFGFQCTR